MIEGCLRCLEPTFHKKEMFWEKVDIRGSGQCWLWTAGKMKSGYGRFGVHLVSRRRSHVWNSHRFAQMLTAGPPPVGAFVLHSCDNPSCCNPAHLRYGSHEENMADMRRRGRSRTGAKNVNAIFGEAEAEQIRQMARDGVVQRRIAEGLGISYSCVCNIINGRTWSANTDV